MAFHFSLEAVLRYRCSLEDRERRKLDALLARRAALMAQIDESGRARRDLQSNSRRALTSGVMSAAQLQLCAIQSDNLAQRAQRLELERNEVQTAILEQSTRYRAERQRRELLQSLRDLQLRQYRIVQQRREQALLDELHLLRHRHN